MTKIIRATKHTINFSNKNKQIRLNDFVDEYRRVASIYIDYFWKKLNIDSNNFSIPKYLDYNEVSPTTFLSARVKSSMVTQIAAMFQASTRKQSKRLWVVHKLLSEGKKPSAKLLNKIRDNKPVKPNAKNINPELSSKCIDIQPGKHFDLFIRLKSLGIPEIKIPVKHTKRSNYWNQQSKQLNSISVSKNNISLRYKSIRIPKSDGAVVGADQGLKTTLTLSNNATTPKYDNHNHSLESITQTLTRRKKGSKSFKKAQDHRTNFINWSINQLNLKNIKQVNLEEIYNIGYKTKTSRYLTHWNNTLIIDKIKRYCSEQEVLVVEQGSAYRSQRCSSCGLVRKANRKGKQYTCKCCGLKIDSDLNAAMNHEQDLYYLGWVLRKYIKDNRLNYGNGFYWRSNGIFNTTGEEFRVPLSTNEDNNI